MTAGYLAALLFPGIAGLLLLAAAWAALAARTGLGQALGLAAALSAAGLGLLAFGAADAALLAVSLAGFGLVLALSAALLTGNASALKPWAAGAALFAALVVLASSAWPALQAAKPAVAGGAMLAQRAALDTGLADVGSALTGAYRAFDALLALTLLATATLGARGLLGFDERSFTPAPDTRAPADSTRHVVARSLAKAAVPALLLFALFALVTAGEGPGGGFAAGILLALAFGLHLLVFGVAASTRALPPPLLQGLGALAILGLLVVGISGLVFGRALMDVRVLGGLSGPEALSLAVRLVECLMALGVAAFCTLLLQLFAGRAGALREGAA
jgi:multicomponent Na+:H+ antiporter subunit B